MFAVAHSPCLARTARADLKAARQLTRGPWESLFLRLNHRRDIRVVLSHGSGFPFIRKEGLSKVAFLLRKRKDPISSSDRMLDSAESWNMRLQTESLVDDVMRTWPATIPVFLRYRIKCVGCPIGPFHTIHDACREHNADAASLLSDLCAAAGQEAAANSIAGIHVSEDSANR